MDFDLEHWLGYIYEVLQVKNVCPQSQFRQLALNLLEKPIRKCCKFIKLNIFPEQSGQDIFDTRFFSILKLILIKKLSASSLFISSSTGFRFNFLKLEHSSVAVFVVLELELATSEFGELHFVCWFPRGLFRDLALFFLEPMISRYNKVYTSQINDNMYSIIVV